MRVSVVEFTKKLAKGRRVKAALAFGIVGSALSGCVVYPSNGYGYGGGYYAAPAFYAPPVVVGIGGGWGGGWGRGWGGGGGWYRGR